MGSLPTSPPSCPTSFLGTSCETLAVLGDAPVDGRRDRVRDAVVAWVEAECRRVPRLILIEDVHWFDPSSEDLCHRLATLARERPLLLLLPVFGPPTARE